MNTLGFIDHLLRNREEVISDLQDSGKVAGITRIGLVVFALMTVLYGLIMGSQSLMHGYMDGWKYSLASALKLPFLFLATLVICIPLFYVLNVLIGPRAQLRTILGILVSSLAVTGVLLASCALILGFFNLSTSSYAFVTLLNVGIFTLAALYGVWFLSKAMRALPAPPQGAGSSNQVGTIITWWLITYGFVGTQMAWLMRPFIGSPGTPFSLFRTQDSNFYVAVATALTHLLVGK